MNRRKQTRSTVWMGVLAAGALALGMIWLAGCSTTVYKQGDQAAGSAEAAALAVQTESQTLAGTMTTLSNLVEKPAADLKPQFHDFSAGLDNLVAAVKRAEAARTQFARSNAAFLAAWTRQLTNITNAQVRSSSETRKAEVSKQVDAASARCEQTQSALRSLVNYLQDIRKALSIDLTPAGIESAKPLVSNANTTASKVQTDLAQTVTDLKALSAQMSSAKGAAATPPGS